VRDGGQHLRPVVDKLKQAALHVVEGLRNRGELPSLASATGIISRDAPIRLTASKSRSSGAMTHRAENAESSAMITPLAIKATTGVPTASPRAFGPLKLQKAAAISVGNGGPAPPGISGPVAAGSRAGQYPRVRPGHRLGP